MTVRDFNKPFLLLENVQKFLLNYIFGRKDIVLFGAHAVNVYVDTEDIRYTSDIDLLSVEPKELASEIAEAIKEKFNIKVKIVNERFFYSIWDKTNKRKLADITFTSELPAFIKVNGIQVLTLQQLIEKKKAAIACPSRKTNKRFQDQADLYLLLKKQGE